MASPGADTESDSSLYYESSEAPTPPTASEREYEANAYWANHHKLPSVIAHNARSARAAQPPSTSPPRAYNPVEGNWSGRQLGETVDEFLRRLPVLTTTIPEAKDAWLWVANPYAPRDDKRNDVETLKERGTALLEAYSENADAIKQELEGKSQAMVTRQLTPLREELRNNLLRLADKTGVTSGKWMLFPSTDALPRTWRLVAEGTASGKLGKLAKVAVDDGSSGSRLICVYTGNFGHLGDVKRVLDGMIELGLVDTKARPIYYKADAYTHLGIEGQNEYGLRNSLWSSWEILKGTASLWATGSGAIKRQATLDETGTVSKKMRR